MTESTSRRPAYARLLDRAVRILAVRDHSEQELRRKLAAPIMGKNGPEEIDATAEDAEQDSVLVNGNKFLFKKGSLDIEKYMEKLYSIGEEQKGNTWTVYLDDEGELVIY